MKFKIIEPIVKVLNVTAGQEVKKAEIEEIKAFDNIMSVSKSGGLRLTFVKNSIWISVARINNYEVNHPYPKG